MIVGGLQKNTLIDYPGKVAATIFVSGCNFRCPWCHNKELVLPEEIVKNPPISLLEVYKFLEERKGFLQGVVLCGGEPTIYEDIVDFASTIKDMGYLIKLDTNGSNPEVLETMIKKRLLDYVAMDIKGPRERYEEIVGRQIDIKRIERSVRILKKDRVDYEFRTTVVPGFLEREDILKIVKWIAPAKKYFLQNFQPGNGIISPEFRERKPFPDDILKAIRKEIASQFDVCQIR